MEGKIEKFDNLGRGILYSNGKITFIPKTCPKDVVEYEIIREHKNYNEGVLVRVIIPSKMRIKPLCPYYDLCGGCDLLHISYEDSIKYKENKIKDLLKKDNYDIKPIVVKNSSIYNYRNKISLKVVDGKIGFYKSKSNTIVEINECLLANTLINNVIKDLSKINIKNGNVTIRTNGKDILLVIDTLDNIDVSKLNVQGKVLNKKLINGSDTIFEEINGIKYITSYDSFFQVNPNIASKLFETIIEYINSDDKVLDLYCGVGAITLQIAKKASIVTGVEIVENAIKNAIYNAKLNNIDNAKFILKDSSKAINDLNELYDCIIVDPPRSGLSKEVCIYLFNSSCKRIIYVSCDPGTLFRDLKILNENYKLINYYLFDMFSFTEHCESLVVLERK